MKDLLVRTVAGILLGIIAVLSVWYIPSYIFKLLIVLIVGISVWELTGLLKKAFFMLNPVQISTAALISTVILFYIDLYMSLIVWILYSFWYSHRVYNLNYLLALGFVFVYGILMISSLGFLHEIDKRLVFILFATVWAGDTFAYFVGKSFGKRKLAPRLSPKKTWEGAFGSIVGSVLFGGGLAFMFGIKTALIPVLISSVIMQIGDLFESFIKRQVNVKDSSHIIPGHGGVLDRIDALIFASVVFYTFYRIFPL